MNEKILREEIKKLIEKFERVKIQGKYKSYNEANTKKDFIEPLFKALGWNVENSEEVKAEEKVSKKRVDYAFRINGVVKFYLEAKSFKESLIDPKYSKQAIEYAWNKSVTWTILCNFEGIRVFNAEWKWNEKFPMRNSFLDLRYNDFLGSSFQYLTWLSKESFEHGILDKNASALGKKTRKLPIDKQLLIDFTEFRNILTKDILKHNQSKILSEDDLDEIVQRILDRLIFIRTCEDKDIESDKLESLVRIFSDNDNKLYSELNKKFREYDLGYNSKLFREHLCEDVIISNDTLKKVILGTYQTKDFSVKYDFSAINADVLGNIYEQYLGHILKKTTQRAKLTNGKIHRKEQGIYYTPTYIVDYIVRNTVREKLKKHKGKVDELKILDPACGSGSFLLKAFDIICEYEVNKEGKTLQTKFENISDGTILKRKTELLKNCIFGVDLDEKAVEISQLNLLLKLAEKRQRLPTLQENIKCGNSLIDEISFAGDKALNYESEFFNIFNTGGFDVIIGNPPYVRIHEFSDDVKRYFKKFESATGQYDIYVLFIEKALKLLKNGGLLGFIVSNKFFISNYGYGLRQYILNNTRIKLIADVSNMNVFKEASVYPVIIILEKQKDKRRIKENKIQVIQNILTVSDLNKKEITFNQNSFLKNEKCIMDVTSTNKEIIEKIEIDSIKLGEISKITRGFRPPSQDLVTLKPGKGVYKYLVGSDLIDEYNINWSGNYVNYIENRIYEAKPLKIFLQPKILIRDIGKRFNACFDNGEYLCLKTIYFVHSINEYNPKFICALLNSKMMLFYFKSKYSSMHIQGGYLRFRKQFLDLLPIKHNIDIEIKIIKIVDEVINLNYKLNNLGNKLTNQRNHIIEQILKNKELIDNFVFNLYHLNQEKNIILKEISEV